MARAIRICLQPKMDNGNNATRSLVFLGFASGTNFTSNMTPLLMLQTHMPDEVKKIYN